MPGKTVRKFAKHCHVLVQRGAQGCVARTSKENGKTSDPALPGTMFISIVSCPLNSDPSVRHTKLGLRARDHGTTFDLSEDGVVEMSI